MAIGDALDFTKGMSLPEQREFGHHTIWPKCWGQGSFWDLTTGHIKIGDWWGRVNGKGDTSWLRKTIRCLWESHLLWLPCPRKERRQERVKLGINENRTLFWPPTIWNVAASGSPFPIHTTNMMYSLSVNQWLPRSKVCWITLRNQVYCVLSQLFSLYVCPRTAPDWSSWSCGS